MKQFELAHVKIIIEVIKNERFLYAWMSSESFFEDLENLYFIHLPSHTDWIALLSSSKCMLVHIKNV